MTQSTTVPRPLPPKFLYKILNPTFATLLRSPLHGLLSSKLLVLAFTGRKSGKHYAIPLGYTQTGETLLLSTSSPWWKNLRDGATVQVRLRGKARSGQASVITDQDEMLACYRIMLPDNDQLGQIIGVQLDAQGQPRLDDVAAARARGNVIVRVQLAP